MLSFDFDDTIRRFDGVAIEATCDQIRHAHAAGQRILITTTRLAIPENITEIVTFCHQCDIQFHAIIMTSGADKFTWLRHLPIQEHWDDDPVEKEGLDSVGIPCRLVPVDEAAFRRFHELG